MCEVVQITDQLHKHRLIEPKALPQRDHGFRGGRAIFACQDIGRVAGHKVQQQEAQHDNAEHGRHRLCRSAPKRSPGALHRAQA